jgi:hypothetical protein
VAIVEDGDKVGEIRNGGSLLFREVPMTSEMAAHFGQVKSSPFAVNAQPGRVRLFELCLPNIAGVGA